MGGEGRGKERGRAEKGGRWEDRGKKGGGINLLHGGFKTLAALFIIKFINCNKQIKTLSLTVKVQI